jgi:hypothetical protein
MKDKDINRFLDKVTFEPNSGCWLWLACGHPTGYGRFGIEGDVLFAHRAAYLLFVGDIPDGMLVCHTCDVRDCVNPGHLFLGTHKDNMQDASRKKRIVTPSRDVIGSTKMKLSSSDVLEIRKSEKTLVEMMKIYGVGRTTIRRARSGQSYTWVK